MPWDLNGNVVADTNFLGTTNDQPLVIQTNNSEALRVGVDGTVGIATPVPKGQLGVVASAGATAIDGESVGARKRGEPFGIGVHGYSSLGIGVKGGSQSGIAVFGESEENEGVHGISHSDSSAVVGLNDVADNEGPPFASPNHSGVYGQAAAFGAAGVYGLNEVGNGVIARGLVGITAAGDTDPGGIGIVCGGGPYGWAMFADGAVFANGGGFFNGGLTVSFGNLSVNGDATVQGKLTKFGGGFRIDHPADPANKYLTHCFVESSEMKNVYDGIAVLNGKGEATVKMPAWFGVLNRDIRYQLTAIGAPGPNLHVGRIISENAFRIAGGEPGMKVSWQITGVRKDPWAQKNPIEVEERKPRNNRGYYLDPQLYRQAKEKAVRAAGSPALRELSPALRKLMKEARATGRGSSTVKSAGTSRARRARSGRSNKKSAS